ncbi:hypothetical protein [Laspinema olomoucense]|uniref:hypothetical protein n=1 Tax=Laspinema olomoucense TaxID=3231600 RepID=UPI0021BB2723|nr:hypothetical protein [Laspinema sp. D3d]MCT7971117.1 hypothetical protein [Laspinema sp. D3d]
MNEPLAKNQTNYKPLLYITANDKSSLQQVVSSAINAPDFVDEKNQSSTESAFIRVLSTSSLIVLGAMFPSPFLISEEFSKTIVLINRIREKNQSINQEKQDEELKSDNVDKLLRSLNLESWSEFLTEISYSSIPEDLDFPPGHPLPNKLYKAHPLKSQSNKYIPIEVFDSLLYSEREAELIRLLVDLGATKITIQEKQIGTIQAEAKAQAKIAGAGGLEGEMKRDVNKLDESIRNFSLQGNAWTPEILNNFREELYSWLPYEPSWKAIVHARLYGKCLTASLELINDNSYSIAAKFGLAEGLLQNVAGLEAGASFNRNQTQRNIISIEFAPPAND